MEYLKNRARRGLPFILGLALIAVAVFAIAPRFINGMAWNGGGPRDRMAQQAGNTARSADPRGAFTGPSQAQAPQAQPGANQSGARGGPNTQAQPSANQPGARGGAAAGGEQSRAQAQPGARGPQSNGRGERRGGGIWRWLIGSPLQWAGIALIGAGLWFLSRRRTPATPPTPPSQSLHPETYEPPQAV